MDLRVRGLAAAAGRRARLVFPEREDPRVAEAIGRLERMGLVQAVPVPDEREALAQRFQLRRAHKGLSLDEARAAVRDPLLAAALLVGEGGAEGLVAGAVATTGETIRAALWGIGCAPGLQTVSSVFLMVFPDGRELLFADCGVVPEPSEDQLVDIALAAADSAELLLDQDPVVALLSFSTLGSARHPAAERTARVAARLVRICPDLAAGNIAYKLCQRLGGVRAVGPVLQGLARPANDLSRGCSADDVVEVGVVTALQVLLPPSQPPRIGLPLRTAPIPG